MNGKRTPSPDDIEQLIGQVQRLQAEIATVERAGAPLPDRINAELAKLEEAKEYFLEVGFFPASGSSEQTRHLQHKALIGAISLVGGNFLATATEKRETVRYGRDVAPGLSTVEKAGWLGELNRDLRKARVALEIAWRAQEGAGLTVERGDLADVELFLAPDRELQGATA